MNSRRSRAAALPFLATATLLSLLARRPCAADPLSVTNLAQLDFRSSGQRWDPPRDSILVSDPTGRRVLRVALADGAVVASWTAPEGRTPQAISVSPDGHRLAVALTTRAHDDYWFDGQSGFVQFLDADTLAAGETLALHLDPWDVAALDDGYVVVAGGSGQWTSTQLFRAGSNDVLGTVQSRQRSYLVPVPGGGRIYLADTDSGPAGFERLDVHPGAAADALAKPGLVYRSTGSPRTRPVIRPGFPWVVLPSGDQLTLDPDPAKDLQRVRNMGLDYVQAVAWDPARPVVATLSMLEPRLSLGHADTLLPITGAQTAVTLEDIAVVGGRLLGTYRDAGHTWIVRIPYAGIGAETNVPPAAAFAWNPSPSTDQPLRVDAAATTDDGGPAGLSFAWDFDGDGVPDGPYATNRLAEYTFSAPGNHTVTLYARDFWGATNTAAKSIAIAPTTNTPPVASFAWTPGVVETGVPVAFDASGSTDDQLPAVPLSVLWDWDGDGTYDTVETNRPTASHIFHVAGPATVTLSVRDVRGATNSITKVLNVVQRADPGVALSGQPAFDLPFRAAAMWTDARRGNAYFTDPDGKRLVRMPLSTGRPDREWRFEFPADALAATDDGKLLYISELVVPRSSFAFGIQAGLIAMLDLDGGNILKEFATDLDPAELLPLGNGRLLVGGGSAQLTLMKNYDTATGAVLGTLDVREDSPLLARTPDRVLALTTFGSAADLNQISVAGDGSLAHDQPASSLVLYAIWGPWALSPDGTSILSANGFRLDVPADPAQPLVFRGRVEIGAGDDYRGAVAFDGDVRRKAVFRGAQQRVDWLETESWTRFKSYPVTPVVRFLGLWSDRLIVAGDGGKGTLVESRANPASGAETNLPPVARVVVGPEPNAAADTTFDASSTTDDTAGTIEFRWDWNGDGTYETDFATNAVVAHRYYTAGTYTVRVQARDRFGALSTASAQVVVAPRTDPGVPGTTNAPFHLSFAATDIAFDGPRHRAYASDGPGQSVVGIDLDTGLEFRRWNFPWTPGHLATTPDSRWLYVVLPESTILDTDNPASGFVAEFDLENVRLNRVIPLDSYPWDVAATDDGILLVSSFSDRFAHLDSHRVSDGVRTGRITTDYRCRLQLDAEQKSVWVTTTTSSPEQYFQATLIRPSGGLSQGPVGTGQPLGPDFLLPLPGNRLLDTVGRVLSASDPRKILFNPATPMSVFDGTVVPGGQWLAAATPDGVRYLELSTGAWLPWAGLPAGPATIGAVGTNHAVATVAANETVFRIRSNPATTPGTNAEPTVDWPPETPASVAVPAYFSIRAIPFDADGQVVAVELWNGGTKIGDVAPGNPFAYLNIPTPSTNQLRWIARDNLGASGTSAVFSVVGRRPPTIQWVLPAVTGVEPNLPFDASVNTTAPDGIVQRVEFRSWADGTPRIVGVATNAPWTATIPGLAGDTSIDATAYDDQGVSSGPVQFVVHVFGAVGDEFYKPFAISGDRFSTNASNANATLQVSENQTQGVGHTLWWRWIAPSNGIVIIDTAGSGIDTALKVILGNQFGGQSLGYNDDAPGGAPFSRLKVPVSAGTTYSIMVGSFASDGGPVVLNLAYAVAFPLAPANDMLAARILIPTPSGEVTGDNTGAGRENFEPTINGTSGGRSVWWEWVAPTAGTATFSTAGSAFDTLLGIYTGPNVPISLSAVGTNDDAAPNDQTSQVTATVQSGRHYYILVDGFFGASGPIRLSVAFNPASAAPPANDDFAAASPIVGDTARIQGTTSGATLEPTEILVSGGTQSVWWKWTAAHAASVYIALDASQVTATVWTGSSVSGLTPAILYSAGPGKWHFNALAGRTYYIRVASFGGNYFTMTFDATLPAAAGGSIVLTPLPSGQLGLVYSSPRAADGVLQTSTNLVDWAGSELRRWTPGETAPLPADDGSATRYYRLLLSL